jgi:hypothetical protein
LTRGSPRGFLSYDALRRHAPDFHAMIGDNVYYDSEPPIATSLALARHFWHRRYSLPARADYYRQTPCYWLKDDHDTLRDDCWPGSGPGKLAPAGDAAWRVSEGRGLGGHCQPRRRVHHAARRGGARRLVNVGSDCPSRDVGFANCHGRHHRRPGYFRAAWLNEVKMVNNQRRQS